MAVKSLEQLKRERNNLLKKDVMRRRGVSAKKSLENLAKSRRLEEQKIRAEIKALKNPKSTEARKQFRSAAGKFGKLVKKGALAINENLERQAAEEERLERLARARRKPATKKKSNSRKPVKRSPPKRTRISRR